MTPITRRRSTGRGRRLEADDDRSAPWCSRPRRPGEPTPPTPPAEETIDLSGGAPAAQPQVTGPATVSTSPASRCRRPGPHDGVLDVIRTTVIEAGSMSGSRILGLRTPEGEGVDIDHPADVGVADAAVRRLAEGAPGA